MYDLTLSLISPLWFEDLYRSHSFSAISAIEVQVVCELGPSNQSIYGRLNEVQIYGPPVPTLPPINVENGMLSFRNDSEFEEAIEYLEYQYVQHTASFVSQYPDKSADELAYIEDAVGFNDQLPYIMFENTYGIYSLRKVLNTQENTWLENGMVGTNPDDLYMWDEDVRTLVNSYGEIKIGDIIYTFYADGSYTEESVGGGPGDDGPPFEELSGINQVEPNALIFSPCKTWKRQKADEYSSDGKWYTVYKLSFFNSMVSLGFAPKGRAWTKSYKRKSNGKYKKRVAWVTAQIHGSVTHTKCDGSSISVLSNFEERKAKKVKAKLWCDNCAVSSGKFKSRHSHEKIVPNLGITLTW